jgi:hypothetical protein
LNPVVNHRCHWGKKKNYCECLSTRRERFLRNLPAIEMAGQNQPSLRDEHKVTRRTKAILNICMTDILETVNRVGSCVATRRELFCATFQPLKWLAKINRRYATNTRSRDEPKAIVNICMTDILGDCKPGGFMRRDANVSWATPSHFNTKPIGRFLTEQSWNFGSA